MKTNFPRALVENRVPARLRLVCLARLARRGASKVASGCGAYPHKPALWPIQPPQTDAALYHQNDTPAPLIFVPDRPDPTDLERAPIQNARMRILG